MAKYKGNEKLNNKTILTHYSIYETTPAIFKRYIKKFNLTLNDFIGVRVDRDRNLSESYFYKFYYKPYLVDINEFVKDKIIYEEQTHKFKFSDYGFITDCATKYKDTITGKWKRYKWCEIWYLMIRRCYDTTKWDYKYYGGKGIYVAEEFKIASNFRDFYIKYNPTGELQLDKDILKKGYYGIDSCVFITPKENKKEALSRKDLTLYETKLVSRRTFRMYCSMLKKDYREYIEIPSKQKNKYFYIYKDRLMVNIYSIHMNDGVNSISGFTDSIFFSGCNIGCKDCWSKVTWDINSGKSHNIVDIYDLLTNSKSKCVSLLGGSPFYFKEKSLCIPLIHWLKENTDKIIYLWTGYPKEEVDNFIDTNLIDVLITDPFDVNLRDLKLLLRGSSNQRLYFRGKQVTEQELLKQVENL